MNTLTALRTFGNPGLCPARRMRIFADRWYLVTMQNTERDIGDGYYLAEGEYTELLSGAKARERRDARLNHCNRIVEYSGTVYAVYTTMYGHMRDEARYFATPKEITEFVTAAYAEHKKWIADCARELANYLNAQLVKFEGWRASAIENCQRVIEEKQDAFSYRIEKER